MVILTAEETRRAEQKCFDNYSSEAELMLNAGTACFEKIIKKYDVFGKTVNVFCGNGKNAGDGFVIARLLHIYGAAVHIVLCDKEPRIKEPLMYFENAVASGVEVKNFDSGDIHCDFIVDTMFGIGFKGEPRAPFDKIFELLKSSDAVIISVDTPSGTNATTGEVCKNCVAADFTIAVSTLKYCHILVPSNEFCGEVVTADIGIPDECYSENYAQTIEVTPPGTNKGFSLPKCKKNANKGTFGRQLNICSSYGMFGAGVICTKAALRSGSGLVELLLPDKAYPLAAAHLTQSVFCPVESDDLGYFSCRAEDKIKRELKRADSVVIGCGIGVSGDNQKIVDAVLKNSTVPIVLDADGINCINQRISILKEVKAPIVLTPHPGEMARLVSKTTAEVQADRINIAKTFAKENNVILVLKGANTVVTDGERLFVNLTGNPGMAMGGSGDMLSGIIGSFIAQGVSVFDSAAAAVYIHGLCGDRAVSKLSRRGITVDDMIDSLGALMSEFE